MSLFIALKVYGLGINLLENNILIIFTTYDYKFFVMFYIRTSMTYNECNRGSHSHMSFNKSVYDFTDV